MTKMNFCPYDGKTIDLDNLAYELIYPSGWDYERVKRETVIGREKRMYISENDSKRSCYNGFKIGDHQVILLAGRNSASKNGLTLLIESLERKTNNAEPAPTGSYKDHLMRLYGLNQNDNTSKEDQAEDDGLEELHYEQKNGIHTFFNTTSDPVMYAVPCCPYCHNRLPEGWESADDFIGLSLVGPSGAGKKAFFYSLIQGGVKALHDVRSYKGIDLSIKPAYYMNGEQDTYYEQMESLARDMCKKRGKVPEELEHGSGHMPYFLHVTYGDQRYNKTMIVGLYEYSEQMLAKMDPMLRPEAKLFYSRMYADLCMIDPEDIPKFAEHSLSLDGKTRFIPCEMMSLEEQAKFQENNKGKVISAATILRAKRETVNEITPAMDFLKRLVQLRKRYEEYGSARNMRFVGVLSKGDYLRDHEKILIDRKYEPAFLKAPDDEKMDAKKRQERSRLMEEFVSEYQVFASKERALFENVYRRGKSWISVSSLGCSTASDGHLKGEYMPANVEEPILECILSKIDDNRWG